MGFMVILSVLAGIFINVEMSLNVAGFFFIFAIVFSAIVFCKMRFEEYRHKTNNKYTGCLVMNATKVFAYYYS